MSQLSEIESAQKSLEECFNKRMTELEAQLHVGGPPAKDTVAKVADEFRAFRELMFKMLSLLRKQIGECYRTVDVIETRHRRKDLIFLGVTEAENEDCTNAVLGIVQNRLGLKDITAVNVKASHRIGAQNKDRPRPILVRFSSLELKSSVWRAKAGLKGSSISVREFLTRTRQAVFGKARLHFGMRAVWTRDGSIVVLTPDGSRHKVISFDELSSLMEKHPKALGNSSLVPRGGVGSSVAGVSKNIPRK